MRKNSLAIIIAVTRHCSQYIFLSLLGLVVQRLIRANQGLNFNVRFIIPLFKSLFGTIFFILFSKRHSIIKLQTKGIVLNILLKLSDPKSGFALTLGYLKPASNNLEINQALGLLQCFPGQNHCAKIDFFKYVKRSYRNGLFSNFLIKVCEKFKSTSFAPSERKSFTPPC